VTVRLKRDARVVLTFRTPSGKIVRRLRVSTKKAGTVVRLRWDGKDARGRYVAAAKYGYSLTAVGHRYLRTARGSVDVLTAR
jgi:flagellar hook assembly protein FlgD